uniref:Uncharacterized protein n=1 Tax=Neovison vison TaxID=452646 RepID=A0A8C7BC63_NEOVI
MFACTVGPAFLVSLLFLHFPVQWPWGAALLLAFIVGIYQSSNEGSGMVFFPMGCGWAFLLVTVPFSFYTTANAESDYERDSDRESDDGEDEVSCETVKIGRRDSLDLELEVASGPVAAALDAAGSPGPEDVLPLLQQADELHQGGEQDRREGFQLLLNNKLAYGSRQDFLWRLARAYSDMCELTEEVSEKKSYALNGNRASLASLLRSSHGFSTVCGNNVSHPRIQLRRAFLEVPASPWQVSKP